MIQILSTRLFTDAQRALLPEGLEVSEYDALEINLLPVSWEGMGESLCIFTSQNAVRACFEGDSRPEHMLNCLCVGKKTAALLEGHGQRILEVASGAAALAEVICAKYSGRSFVYFCGNRRLETLPARLKEAGISVEERVVYQTGLQSLPFEIDPDIILFFSPSGVESFIETRALEGKTAVCIGPTTARAAKKYTKQIIIAKTRSVEAVIQAVADFTANAYET